MKKLAVLLFSVLSITAYADEEKLKEFGAIFSGGSACPFDKVKALLKDEDLSFVSETGDTYLTVLGRTARDCFEIVDYLFENGALENIDHIDSMGYRAINYFEADYVHYREKQYTGNKSANIIADALADPTAKILNHTFWRKSSTEDITTVLAEEPDFTAETMSFVEWKKAYPLRGVSFAIQSKRPEVVGLLIESEADFDYVDSLGMTPLMYSAHYYNSDITGKVADKSTQDTIDKRDNRGMSALNYAEACIDGNTVCNSDKSKLLLSKMKSSTAKMLSYTYWQNVTMEEARADIASGDINAYIVSPAGRYPVLWFAVVACRDYSIIQLLFNNGVNRYYGTVASNIYDEVNYMRLYNDKDEMINFLMKNGIKK